jgi:hypothetical protein
VVEIKKVERVGDLSRHIIEGHGESTHIVPETGQNKTVSSYEILGIYDDSYVTLTYICNINHVKDKVEHTTVGTILLRKEPGGNMLKGFWKGWKENGDPTGGPVFWRKR